MKKIILNLSSTTFFGKKVVLDLLFPIHCLACGKEGEFICSQCLKKISLSARQIKLDKPSLANAMAGKQNSLKKIIAVTDYKHLLVKNAIHRYKYDFVKELSKPLGILMAEKLNSFFLNAKTVLKNHNCILIPVPLHKKRLCWRGFNQSELLCQEISKQLNIPTNNNILIRIKNTPPQAKIENQIERSANIQNAFTLNPLPRSDLGKEYSPRSDLCKNKTVILVDDITTTGATLKECAQAIAPLHPKSIYALVLAR